MTRAPLSSGPGVLGSAASRAAAKKKKEHFTQRWPNGVRGLSGGTLQTNVSRVSLCAVESLYRRMFDLSLVSSRWCAFCAAHFASQTLARDFFFFHPVWKRTTNLRIVTLKSQPSVFQLSGPTRFQPTARYSVSDTRHSDTTGGKMLLALAAHVEEATARLWRCLGWISLSNKKEWRYGARDLTLKIINNMIIWMINCGHIINIMCIINLFPWNTNLFPQNIDSSLRNMNLFPQNMNSSPQNKS